MNIAGEELSFAGRKWSKVKYEKDGVNNVSFGQTGTALPRSFKLQGGKTQP